MIAIAGGLHEIFASEWNRIGLFDDEGRIGAGYAEHPGCVPLMLANLELFFGRDAWWTKNHPAWFAKNTVGDLLNSKFLSGYEQTEIFDVIERPLNVHWMLDSIQPLESGKLGIQLLRSRGDRPFTDDDVRRLRSVRPWIAHALRDPPDQPVSSEGPPGLVLAAAKSVQTATLIMDRSGHTLFRSESAAYLVSILGGMDRELKSAPLSRMSDLPGPIRAVVSSLLKASLGQTGPVPQSNVRTKWGVVDIDASWLSATALQEGEQSLISIHLSLREHAVAYASRVLRDLGATPAQVRVGILLALGKRKPDIAKELGIRLSSVEDAARKLYGRLDVHSAGEFGTLLWLTGFE